MRIAIISDIHSNLTALTATLDDIKKQKIKRIFCLGDIIGKGSNASKCIKLVRENCEVVLQGNTDIRFSSDAEEFKDDKVEYSRINWNHTLMTEEEMNYLRNLPFSHELKLGKNLIRFFHATPFSQFEVMNPNENNLKTKYEMFIPSIHTPSQAVANIVIYGHLHMQLIEEIYNRTLICCGSAGNSVSLIQNPKRNFSPDEITKAHYLVLNYNNKTKDFSFEFRRVSYDIQKELKCDNLEKEDYSLELTEGRYRNIAKTNTYLNKNNFYNL